MVLDCIDSCSLSTSLLVFVCMLVFFCFLFKRMLQTALIVCIELWPLPIGVRVILFLVQIPSATA